MHKETRISSKIIVTLEIILILLMSSVFQDELAQGAPVDWKSGLELKSITPLQL